MSRLQGAQLDNAQGWLCLCTNCMSYNYYTPGKPCSECGNKSFDVFYKCPKCKAHTDSGETKCSGCGAKIPNR